MYDFHNVDYDGKDQITFEDKPIGTLNICGRILDANKYTNFTFCSETQTLTIIIDTRKWDFRLKRETHFSFNINVNDAAPCESIKGGPPQPTVQDKDQDTVQGSINLKDGEHCTLLNSSGDRGLVVWNSNGYLNYGTKENRDNDYYYLKVDDQWYYLKCPDNSIALYTLSQYTYPPQYVTVELWNQSKWCGLSKAKTYINFYISWNSGGDNSLNLEAA